MPRASGCPMETPLMSAATLLGFRNGPSFLYEQDRDPVGQDGAASHVRCLGCPKLISLLDYDAILPCC